MPGENNQTTEKPELERSLGPLTLWGLGVGYVIGGEYFGWNLGLVSGGSVGMLVAFLIVTVLYITFVFSYAEMACSVPKAGGVFDYAQLGLGKFWAYVSGLAQVIEFLFAPPALAMAVGSYLAPILPESFGLSPRFLAIVSLILVTLINIRGVRQAAAFELAIAIVASLGLILFAWLVAPAYKTSNFLADSWPNGWHGVFQAVPFAIWFYLGIEGLANVAEESRNPVRDIPRGFGAALFTLIVLAALVMVLSVGVAGWHGVVYNRIDLTGSVETGWVVAPNAVKSDSPLTLALDYAVPSGSWGSLLFQGMCLFGLVSSLNGLTLGSGRAILEMGRARYLPGILGRVHPEFHTPANALVFNLIVGTLALILLDTAKLITWSALGACMLYILSIPALFGLRKKHPNLNRPFRTPFFPQMPIIAFLLSMFCFFAMIIGNLQEPGALAPLLGYCTIIMEFAAFWVIALICYMLFEKRINHPIPSDIENQE
jgi:ethanolamine permease